MSSSVTLWCRLFTVIFVPSNGLNTGWKDIWNIYDKIKQMLSKWLKIKNVYKGVDEAIVIRWQVWTLFNHPTCNMHSSSKTSTKFWGSSQRQFLKILNVKTAGYFLTRGRPINTKSFSIEATFLWKCKTTRSCVFLHNTMNYYWLERFYLQTWFLPNKALL